MANARLAQLDYYALLKVHPDASIDEIRRAFHRFAAKYHPDRFASRQADEALLERASEIYRRGAEAYRVLCDPTQRRRYDAGLKDGRLRFDPTAEVAGANAHGARLPLKVRNPAARPFATKAERAYREQDWSACAFNLKLALNKDRGNAQLEALLNEVQAKLEGAR